MTQPTEGGTALGLKDKEWGQHEPSWSRRIRTNNYSA